MNVFRLHGDLFHILAILVLLYKIVKFKSCEGISGKSQILLALVFTTRYIDLFMYYISLYNTLMKIFFLCSTYTTIWLIYSRKKCERDLDTFAFEFLLPIGAALALKFNYQFTVLEICWAFSIYLEAAALWPQFYIISKTKQVAGIMFYYLTCLGLYRMFYIANWIYKYSYEDHYDVISSVSGLVQVVPYVIFWGFCMEKGFVVRDDKISWLANNLKQTNGENEIFIIDVKKDAEATKEEFVKPKELGQM